jgi:hypothetical protein
MTEATAIVLADEKVKTVWLYGYYHINNAVGLGTGTYRNITAGIEGCGNSMEG